MTDGAGRESGGPRAARAGLTTRGRSFLAAGVAAALCAYLFGEPDLLRIGLLLAALPLMCAVAVHRTRYRVASARRLTPPRVAAMSEARVEVRLENVSRLATGPLTLQDRVPRTLGPGPRFALDPVEPGGHREVSYRVRGDLRGRYRLGPLRLRLTDPFGMCELTRSLGAHDTLTIVPRVEPLPPVGLTGDAGGYGERCTKAPAMAGEDDIMPRGYRVGDDLRRVHWRSTARFGELMVRREEQPHRARCAVLLDTRAVGYTAAEPDPAFEWAVSGTASVAAHLLARGYGVRLLTDAGSSRTPYGSGAVGAQSADAAAELLDALAGVDHSQRTGLDGAYQALRESGAGALLVAFLGELDEEQAALAGRMRQRGGRAVAFLLDPAAWTARGGPDPCPDVPPSAAGRGAPDTPPRPWPRDDGRPAHAARLLREAGWTVLPVAAGDTLPALWRHAGGSPFRESREETGSTS